MQGTPEESIDELDVLLMESCGLVLFVQTAHSPVDRPLDRGRGSMPIDCDKVKLSKTLLSLMHMAPCCYSSARAALLPLSLTLSDRHGGATLWSAERM